MADRSLRRRLLERVSAFMSRIPKLCGLQATQSTTCNLSNSSSEGRSFGHHNKPDDKEDQAPESTQPPSTEPTENSPGNEYEERLDRKVCMNAMLSEIYPGVPFYTQNEMQALKDHAVGKKLIIDGAPVALINARESVAHHQRGLEGRSSWRRGPELDTIEVEYHRQELVKTKQRVLDEEKAGLPNGGIRSEDFPGPVNLNHRHRARPAVMYKKPPNLIDLETDFDGTITDLYAASLLRPEDMRPHHAALAATHVESYRRARAAG